jgi:hypothetical protein
MAKLNFFFKPRPIHFTHSPAIPMKNTAVVAMLACVIGLFSGCVTQLNSDVAPDANLAAIKTIYVVRLAQDERGVDRMIADRLNLMGKQATSGEAGKAPADVDAIVTYQDKWMWDITMYMIELNVQVRKPKSEFAIASGHSMRTSLVRKSPPEMVAEVLGDIFKTK